MAPVQRVEIVGTDAPALDRRYSTASKIVVDHDDLVRYGDNTIADALQRVPGVSIARSAGKDAEIRLRGLGNGYTQILVNGDPVPPGFSIESLNPNLVDHIDVLRSATADMSAQSIAGTINIILKRPTLTPWSYKFSFTEDDGRPSANGSFDMNGKVGRASWQLGFSGGMTRDNGRSTSVTTGNGTAGAAPYAFVTDTIERDKQLAAAVTPQLSWKLAGGGSLGLSALLQARHVTYADDDARTARFGDGFDFATDSLRSVDDSRLGRATLDWKSRSDADDRGEAKLVLSTNTRAIHADFDGRDGGGTALLGRLVHSTMRDSAAIAKGKAEFALGDDHTLGIGWDGQVGRRDEHRVQDETSTVGYPTTDLDEDYTADIQRLAFFLQDEWQASRLISLYAGVRWEGLRTRVAGSDLASTGTHSSVWSPTLQAIWKVPGTTSDQVRLSLDRTYKAPRPRDLVPRLWVVAENSPTNPDFRGNPDLRPELSWGADASYERYLGEGATMSLNAYVRRIHDVVMQQIYLDGATWIQSPVNATSAEVRGLEFETKGRLRQLVAGNDIPDVDLRVGATRNWSHIDGVPGPGARLSQQTPYSANLGLDWHLKARPLTLGASFVFERGGYARASLTEAVTKPNKRLLDVYALWKVDKQSQWRATITNVLAPHATTATGYADEDLEESTARTDRTTPAVKLQYEAKF
jgi:outer membrane receptor for ferrienterochelin and colicin